ncbi:MAG: DUF1573 domain-containing protein [Mangrovibacterium sp.]
MKINKNILATLFVMLFSVSVFAQQAELTFSETQHNFGDITEQGGPVTFTFHFKNTGNSPLILNSVNASCGCTTPVWTKAPVAPGQSGTIQVTYNPQNRPGAFNKSIAINSNAKNSQMSLFISGNVAQRPKTLEEQYSREVGTIRSKSNYIRLGDVKNTEVKEGILEVANTSDKPQKIEFRTPPSHLSISIKPEVLQPGEEGVVTVHFDGRQYANFGEVISRLYLLEDGVASYKNSFGISANLIEDFSSLTAKELADAPIVSFNTLTHDFGDIGGTDKVSYSFQLTNKGKTNLVIRKISTSCGCTAVNPQTKVIEPGKTIPLEVQFDPKGKSGRQAKTITVVTNAPDGQLSTLRINAVIKS